MTAISGESGILEIAALVSAALNEAGITAVLSGGAAVSIYTDNAYMSYDLDFVTSASNREIEKALAPLGFRKTAGRMFKHDATEYLIEFPAGPVSFGGKAVREWERLKTANGVIQIISPTQSVMDRLASFCHWNDPQCLEQAVAITKSHPVDFDAIRAWSEEEGTSEKLDRFFGLCNKP